MSAPECVSREDAISKPAAATEWKAQRSLSRSLSLCIQDSSKLTLIKWISLLHHDGTSEHSTPQQYAVTILYLW